MSLTLRKITRTMKVLMSCVPSHWNCTRSSHGSVSGRGSWTPSYFSGGQSVADSSWSWTDVDRMVHSFQRPSKKTMAMSYYPRNLTKTSGPKCDYCRDWFGILSDQRMRSCHCLDCSVTVGQRPLGVVESIECSYYWYLDLLSLFHCSSYCCSAFRFPWWIPDWSPELLI